jgi:hypothetical protein
MDYVSCSSTPTCRRVNAKSYSGKFMQGTKLALRFDQHFVMSHFRL